ncbi:hypothetical protein FZD47_21145 [Bacillus infantis]|uniref:Uncharacterized protein n=1 Tax=Bacillus infantis TaxID=324767 RepID=A0A5D4SAN3_9BACI|nr:hypothetical protein [Bacillus infantis]TYS60717.1 hypothetical protein FZD47_21145 [Bacillus infantis]
MKKSYSRLNLLSEQLSGQREPRGFFKHFFTHRRYITVSIPYYDYLRGKVFIDDLRNNFQDQVPFNFDFVVLLYLLYDDFLNQIKRGAKNKDIANYLIAGYNRHFINQKKKKRVMKQLTKHVFEFDELEEEVQEEEEKVAYLEIRLNESEILRAEVLIHDLESYLSDYELTIEKLICIVYLDFIDQIKNEGNSLSVQKSILAHL